MSLAFSESEYVEGSHVWDSTCCKFDQNSNQNTSFQNIQPRHRVTYLHCKKSDFRFVKSTVAKLKVKECNVLFSVILFCIIFAKEIIFVLSSIMVLVCNITFLKSNMTFVKSIIHIIEWMCYELLYTHVVVLVKIGRVLFSYYMYFLHYWLFAGLGIFAL